MTEMEQPQGPMLSEADLAYWRAEIRRAEQTRKDVSARHDWQGNLDRYVPRDVKKTEGEVNVGADFRDVERKAAALWSSLPVVGLTCDDPDQPLVQVPPPQPGQPPPPPPPTIGSLTLVHQELMNALLGPTETALHPTIRKCLLDVLAASGVGAVRVGYQATIEQVMTEPVRDPMTGMELAPAQPMDVPIHEAWFASRISPLALLLPADFKDTDSRHLPWVGYQWRKPLSQVRRDYQVPDTTEIPAGGHAAPAFYQEDAARTTPDDPHVNGVTLEYRAALRGMASHPEVIWQLVLVEGMDTPLVHAASPHQTVGPDGRLTPDSLLTFSILPLWLRDLPDSCYPPADCAVTAPLTRELNKFRTQMVQVRDAARDVILYDPAKLNPEAKEKVERGQIGRMVPVEPEMLASGIDTVMKQVATASLGREHYTANDYIERDRDAILGIGANQSGTTTQSERSATEVSTIQRNSEARFEHERQRLIQWFLQITRALDALVLRYGDARLATRLLGPRKGGLWGQFKGAIAGGYRYDMQNDSGKYLDIEANRRQWLQMYQMTAQDPYTNRSVVLKKLGAAWGLDPAEWVVQPEPPKPPPVQAAVSLKGADFDPTLPAFPIIIHIAQKGGWEIPPEVIAAAEAKGQQLLLMGMQAPGMAQPAGQQGPRPDTAHGGAASQVHPLSQRQAEESGDRTGPKT